MGSFASCSCWSCGVLSVVLPCVLWDALCASCPLASRLPKLRPFLGNNRAVVGAFFLTCPFAVVLFVRVPVSHFEVLCTILCLATLSR